MTRGPRCTPRTQAALGLALCVLLAWPPLRHALEASMWRHMVLQFPLLMAAGALLAAALPPRARGAVARWNAHGIAGLVLVACVLAVLMVPRVLDLAPAGVTRSAAAAASAVTAFDRRACCRLPVTGPAVARNRTRVA